MKNLSISEILNKVLEESGYKKLLEEENEEDAVKLMTIHSSKGLEFNNVFVIHLSEGILPSSKVKTTDAYE